MSINPLIGYCDQRMPSVSPNQQDGSRRRFGRPADGACDETPRCVFENRLVTKATLDCTDTTTAARAGTQCFESVGVPIQVVYPIAIGTHLIQLNMSCFNCGSSSGSSGTRRSRPNILRRQRFSPYAPRPTGTAPGYASSAAESGVTSFHGRRKSRCASASAYF